jgi:protein involved in polysaccharide export with SLBB domain
MRKPSVLGGSSSQIRGVFFSRWFRLSIALAGSMVAVSPAKGQTQYASGNLTSRIDLISAAERAELARNAVLAASIRQRLRDGDFQVGDRVFVAVVSDVMHRDTLVVRTGRVLELPGKITVPLTGVLRSELKDRVTEEVMKYVRAREIEVTPLTRLGVLGEVARPGFFAFASDTPIADAIMGAGGPTPLADIQRSVIRRGSKILRSSEETRTAIATGLTLDQFGINAGDELVIGKQREFNTTTVVSVVGVVASVLTIFVALRH